MNIRLIRLRIAGLVLLLSSYACNQHSGVGSELTSNEVSGGQDQKKIDQCFNRLIPMTMQGERAGEGDLFTRDGVVATWSYERGGCIYNSVGKSQFLHEGVLVREVFVSNNDSSKGPIASEVKGLLEISGDLAFANLNGQKLAVASLSSYPEFPEIKYIELAPDLRLDAAQNLHLVVK